MCIHLFTYAFSNAELLAQTIRRELVRCCFLVLTCRLLSFLLPFSPSFCILNVSNRKPKKVGTQNAGPGLQTHSNKIVIAQQKRVLHLLSLSLFFFFFVTISMFFNTSQLFSSISRTR